MRFIARVLKIGFKRYYAIIEFCKIKVIAKTLALALRALCLASLAFATVASLETVDTRNAEAKSEVENMSKY